MKKLHHNRIYLSPPHMSGYEMGYIREAFEQNWIAPLGPNVNAFEKSLAKYCNIKYVAALSSGTAAIHLALIMLGVRPQDEVIASTFTFSATINPIMYLGATPVLIDSEPETWNMCPELLEKAIKDRLSKKKKPKAIIPVHLYGMPANMDAIMDIANSYEIPVIEDAAEALGSRYKNIPLGAYGIMGVLSFNGNKIITTSGGGALISSDKAFISRARFLATQARDPAPHYQHSQVGYNYRMSNVLAGIGRGQVKVIDQRVAQKRKNFESYKALMQDLKGISFIDEPNVDYYSNRWLTTVLIDPAKSETDRKEVQKTLEKENIETRPLWKPMHLQPVCSEYPAFLNGVSEQLFAQGLCLPSGSALTQEDKQRIVEIIRKCFT